MFSLSEPVTGWSGETCVRWLRDLGLGAYVAGALVSGWLRGQALAVARPDDIERHLGIKVGLWALWPSGTAVEGCAGRTGFDHHHHSGIRQFLHSSLLPGVPKKTGQT